LTLFGAGEKAYREMDVKAFFLERSGRQRRYLRRYHSSEPLSKGHFHNAMVLIDTVADSNNVIRMGRGKFAGDPRWPTKCETCDYQFSDADAAQVFYASLYRRTDTGEEMTLHDAPPGAIWDAHWLHDMKGMVGPDGLSLVAVCPGGSHWHIDGRASNCTLPGDLVHKCWVRHGTPPDLTVDKNGLTCAAGAGSIATPNWHGFLRSGFFVT
jgi:hypothetical protein